MNISKKNSIFTYISAVSRKGYKKDMEQDNQDSYFIECPFENDPNKVFFGVFDGHGAHGHKISQFLSKNFSSIL